MPLNPEYPITEAFGIDAGAEFINLPVPNSSQIGITNGAASFHDGFVPLNFEPIESGGIPPSGADFNGLLFMITQYCAGLQAGLFCQYNAAVSTLLGGYAQGAILAQASGGGFWISTANDNTSDPDTGGANWLAISPNAASYITDAPASATENDYNIGGQMGPTVATVDLTPSVNCQITGIEAGANNQEIVICNLSGSFTLELMTLNAGSMAANRIRLPANMMIVQNGSIRLRYSTSVNLWIQA